MLDFRPIHLTKQPVDRIKDTSYYNPEVKEKFTKDGAKTFRVRGTARGDRVHYLGDDTARTAEMEVIKALIHSVESDRLHNKKYAQWTTLNIKDYYLLSTPMLSKARVCANLTEVYPQVSTV